MRLSQVASFHGRSVHEGEADKRSLKLLQQKN